MNLLRNSLRIPPRSCLTWTSSNSMLYQRIWHVHAQAVCMPTKHNPLIVGPCLIAYGLYTHKAQSTDCWALSYCLWYTLSLSLIHFLPRFTQATWWYTFNLHSRHKSRLPVLSKERSRCGACLGGSITCKK